MSQTQATSGNQFTDHLQDGTFVRTAGGVLAIGSVVMVIGGALHPPSASEISVIAEDMLRWGASHWLFAAGAFLVSLGGLLLLTARSELAADWYTFTSWAAIVLGSLLSVVFLLGEATVLPQLATTGQSTRFVAWRAFIETGAIASLLPVSVGLLLVAWSQARLTDSRTPAWAAWGGVAAFGVGIVWIVGFGFLGIESLGPLFLVELVGFIWLGWLGLNLARSGSSGRERRTASASPTE